MATSERPPVNLNKRVLTHTERQELKREIEHTEDQVRDPDSGRSFRTGSGVLDRNLARKSARKAKEALEQQGPDPQPSPEAKEYLKAEITKLEEQIRQGMPTQHEMRANPPGTVAKHMRWEKANKTSILRWKNAKRRLTPDDDDPDLANVEILREPGTRWVPTEAYRQGHEAAFAKKG